jgi:hypothetical protein
VRCGSLASLAVVVLRGGRLAVVVPAALLAGVLPRARLLPGAGV